MSKFENSSNSKIRVALFGAGKMGLHHIRAINLQNNARLVAIADPNAKLEELGSFLSENVSIFENAEELLQTIKPDVVHVCTPPDTHAAMAILALKQKANVYVEKPFALSMREAQDIILLASESGLKVSAGHQLLFEEPGLKAKELVKKIGQIVHVESYFSFHTVRRSPDGRAAMSPTEQLIDILPHPVCLLLHFLKLNQSEESQIPIEVSSLKIQKSGNVHGIIQCGNTTGVLVVTLEGRPIESYVRVVGTNGNLYADFIRGVVKLLAGPGISSISKVINPYSEAWQSITGTSLALAKRILRKQKSYPGLSEIIKAFYDSMKPGNPPAMSPLSILETVSICEEIVKKLRNAEAEDNAISEDILKRKESQLAAPNKTNGGILITGGTGLLGRVLASELRQRNRFVRIVARRVPPAAHRIPGVEYTSADLGVNVSPELLRGISTVVHCAAETVGGREAHERNSIGSTRNIMNLMAEAGVKKLIHISSIAVLKTSQEMGGPIDEDTPLDSNNEDRGPYVWGKAQSERLATELSRSLGIDLRIIRPGPLVDFNDFEAPGRLGREVGPFFVAMGNRKSKLNICTVQTAAKVIHEYVEHFDAVPPVLNLIEPNAPTRADLASRFLSQRPDLHIIWMPSVILWILSPALKIVQRLARPGKRPLDIRSAFASIEYKSDLANRIVRLANKTEHSESKADN